MDFVSGWRRRTFGAAGASLLVPGVVLAAALGVGVVGAGAGGLGDLSEALTGPALPVATTQLPTPGRDGRRTSDTDTLLADALPARSSAPARRSPGSGSGTRRTAGGGPTPTGDTNRPNTTDGPQGPSSTPGPPSSNTPSQPSAPTPAPTQPPQSPIRQVGDEVKQTVEPLPVVGPTGSEVIDTVVDTVDALPVP